MPEADAAAIEIIGRHLDDHPVAGERPDAVLLHLARRVGEHHMLVIQFHAIVAVGEDLDDGPLEFEHFFLRHSRSPGSVMHETGTYFKLPDGRIRSSPAPNSAMKKSWIS